MAFEQESALWHRELYRLWWSVWEKNLKENGRVYMYNWITWLSSRQDHNLVDQGVPAVAQWKGIWLVSMRMWVQLLALLSGSGIWRCCELWCRSRCGLNPSLLWLWYRLATVALICPLPWELPYAKSVALKKKKKKKKKLYINYTSIRLWKMWKN